MELLQKLQKHGLNVVLLTENSLGVSPKELLTDELRELIKNHKDEIIQALRGEDVITLDYCRQKQCEHLFDHKPNPRCLHPMCTKGGRYPAGLWLGMLVKCPAECGQVIWKH